MDALKLKIARLRTELAFLYGNSCHGGPNSQDEMNRLRAQIDELVSSLAEKRTGTLRLCSGQAPAGATGKEIIKREARNCPPGHPERSEEPRVSLSEAS